jgi:hypothetical protein|nr:MAG TPA: hypothetical protein [Caudoviricetes sp.]
MRENILLDTLPETAVVNGKVYFIDSDFRTCIIFEKVVADGTLSNRDKVEEMIDLFFTEERPTDYKGAVNAILNFYRCGEPEKKKQQVRKNGFVELKPKMIYNYEIDAPYIFGAFLTQYRIDLNEIEYLHWWKFQALFKSLESHNKIVEMMSYRATDLSSIENKRERERIAKLKRIYDLPENLTFEEKVARAGAAFGGG